MCYIMSHRLQGLTVFWFTTAISTQSTRGFRILVHINGLRGIKIGCNIYSLALIRLIRFPISVINHHFAKNRFMVCARIPDVSEL